MNLFCSILCIHDYETFGLLQHQCQAESKYLCYIENQFVFQVSEITAVYCIMRLRTTVSLYSGLRRLEKELRGLRMRTSVVMPAIRQGSQGNLIHGEASLGLRP